MGICQSSQVAPMEPEEYREKIKILLLGAGESGKTTFTKQLKMINKKPFTPGELELFKKMVYRNIYSVMGQLLDGRSRLHFQWENPESEALANKFFPIDSRFDEDLLSVEVLEAIERLWRDFALKKVWLERAACQIYDCGEYLLDNVVRYMDPEFKLTNMDILMTRVRSLGAIEVKIHTPEVTFCITDVGGQRNERKKWIHAFEGVDAVIFFVALSEYDQHLFEDEDIPRIKESMSLFDDVCNCEWFANTDIFLFLNKVDLFEKKLANSPLKRAFPGYHYTGPHNDFQAQVNHAISYITSKFLSLNRSDSRTIKAFPTTAMDPINIQIVFHTVQEMVLKSMVGSASLSAPPPRSTVVRSSNKAKDQPKFQTPANKPVAVAIAGSAGRRRRSSHCCQGASLLASSCTNGHHSGSVPWLSLTF